MRTVRGLSGVVISYNRRDVIETCLNAARICEELIVVDKSSNDGTAEIARRIADKVVEARLGARLSRRPAQARWLWPPGTGSSIWMTMSA